MKKTIKEDNERFVMQRELINDNTLLEYTADQGYMIVGVRYVDSSSRSIKEHILLKMNIVEFMKHQQELIEVNEGKTSIAIFFPVEDGYILREVYNTVEHEFGIPDFLDIEYQKAFPSTQIDKKYLKKYKVQ